MINDQCLVQLNRNYLEALAAKVAALGVDRCKNICKCLEEIDSKSSKLLNIFLTQDLNHINDSIYIHLSNLGQSSDESHLDSGPESQVELNPVNKIEELDDFYDWIIVSLFDKLNGAIIKSAVGFDELMSHTDIDKVPLSYLVPPYQALYFQFSNQIKFTSAELSISDSISGAYLFSRKSDNNLYMECHLIRSDKLNEQTFYAYDTKIIDISDEGGFFSTEDGYSEFKEENLETESLFNQVYPVIFKTILYMGLKEARIKTVNERDEYEHNLQTVKAKKAKKMATKVNRKFNYILVGAETETSKQSLVTGTSERSMPIHWRRGHMRNQKYGPNLENAHLVWIKPTLVNSALVNHSDVVKPKDYIVKT